MIRHRTKVGLGALGAVSLLLAALITSPVAAAPPAHRPAQSDVPAPRDASFCKLITDLDSLPPEILAELFAEGYAEVRDTLAKCQRGTIPPSPPMKLKKPKVPRVAVPSAFWAYIRYSHTDVSFKTIPLADPEICTRFVNGDSLTLSSSSPGFVIVGGAIGEIPVTSTYNDVQRSDPTGCETPQPSKDGLYPGIMSVRLMSTDRLEIGPSLSCAGYFPLPNVGLPCEMLGLSETLPQSIVLSAKVQKDLKNPRKGVVKILLSGSGSGDATSPDPRTCTSWGDGDPSYGCGWVSAWAAQLILVRAEPLDLPVFS